MKLNHKQAAKIAAAAWNGGRPVEVDLRANLNGSIRVVCVGKGAPNAFTLSRDGSVRP